MQILDYWAFQNKYSRIASWRLQCLEILERLKDEGLKRHSTSPKKKRPNKNKKTKYLLHPTRLAYSQYRFASKDTNWTIVILGQST